MSKRGDEEEEPAAVPLLDQVSSRTLARAAAEYEPRQLTLGEENGNARRAPDLLRLFAALILPPCFFALAAVMFFGLARGSAGKLAGDGRFSAVDALMVALIVLAAVAVFGQGLGLLRRQPRGRKLLTRVSAAVPRRAAAGEPVAAAGAPLFLDQIDVEALAAMAPAGLGSASRLAAAGRAGWRTTDTFAWIVLGIISVAVAALAAFGMGFAVWRALEGGSYTPLLVMLAVFCGMAFFGLAMMARVTIIAIFDRSRRRRRPAVIRLVRTGSRRMTGGDSGQGQSRPVATIVSSLAALTLLTAAFWPEVTDAFEGFGGDDGVVAASPSGTATATATGIATTPTPVPNTATASAGGSTATAATASPTSTTAAATPTGTGGVATATATSPNTPSSTATFTPTSTPTRTPTPTATATPTPTAIPTATPTPTITPTPIPLDSDNDGVPNSVEIQYGSNPNNVSSTPESAAYDATFGDNTCSDGVDNDGDLGTDTGGMGTAGDPACA